MDLGLLLRLSFMVRDRVEALTRVLVKRYFLSFSPLDKSIQPRPNRGFSPNDKSIQVKEDNK